MCFGGDDVPDAPQLQAAPPLEEMKAVFDEIFGVKMETVDHPSGKGKMVVKKRLQRTPERQALFDYGTRLIQQGIQSMDKMYQAHPQLLGKFANYINFIGTMNRERRADMEAIVNVPDFQHYVDNFVNLQEKAVDEEYRMAENAVRERANRMGYGNSSSLNEALAVLEGKRADKRADIRGKTPAYAAELRKEQRQDIGEMTKLKEGVRTGISTDMARMFGLEQEMFADEMGMAEGMFNKGGKLLQRDDDVLKSSDASAMAFQDKQMTNSLNLQRNAQENNRLAQQHQMEINSYNAQGDGLFGNMLKLGAGLGMSYLGGGLGTAGSLWGKQLFENWGT